MEDIKKISFSYSLKHIPLTNKKEYLTKMYDATSKFINRLRWKVFFCNKEINDPYEHKEEDIFKSSRSAPACEELKSFENDLFSTIKNIKFTPYKSKFQKTLKKDLEQVLAKNKIILFADKTRNLYQTSPSNYKKLLTNNVTKAYKISNEDIIAQINSESQEIINDRKYKNKKIPKFSTSDAFVTIKDHKKNFPNNIECRLLNPDKNELGRISKNILEKAVAEIRHKSKLVQWKNSFEVIDWFNSVENKTRKCFINFDIVNFYPSINENHLTSAINFAKKYTTIEDRDIKLIKHTCKTILTFNKKTWIKKDDDNLFDVPMGSFFGAELCDLIGLYILSKLENLYDIKGIGLYRDDGVAIIEHKNNQHLENMKKKTIKIFKDIGFKITIDTGATKCNFLDVTLDLSNNEFKPYKKENTEIRYINNNSNHPKIIKKNLPAMVENRLIRLSKNRKTFNENICTYQNALNKSNFKHKLTYREDVNEQKKKNKNRSRKTIYFNPPFCQSVKTNVGKIFFELINKHFKGNDELNKLINRNNCKLSYSCMNNIKMLIQKHKKRTLNKFDKTEKVNTETKEPLCNCRNKNECPLKNKCLTKNVIYKATVASKKETKQYIGSTGGPFKTRWYGHNNDFKTQKENGTELSKYIWKLKNNKTDYKITWSILHQIGNITNPQRICMTCTYEKMEIAGASGRSSLNKRNELVCSCPHFKKLYFKT